MSDIHLNIHAAKTNLSRYLSELSSDDRIILCRRNQPVAEIRLLPHPTRQRQLGLAKGDFVLEPSFFDLLPNEILDGFEGIL